MSDLSFLIQTQKEVIVDESYLQKCKQQQIQKQKQQTYTNCGPSRVLSSREIKINTNFMPNRRMPTSPRSCNMKNGSSFKGDQSQQLTKVSMRIDALNQNQKRLEQRFTKQFTNLHNSISSQKSQYHELMAELHGIKNQINQSKKAIGEVLNGLMPKGK